MFSLRVNTYILNNLHFNVTANALIVRLFEKLEFVLLRMFIE